MREIASYYNYVYLTTHACTSEITSTVERSIRDEAEKHWYRGQFKSDKYCNFNLYTDPV